MASETFIGLVLGVAAAITWAVVYTMQQYVLKELSVAQLYFAFLLFSLIILVPFFALRKIPIDFLFRLDRTLVLVVVSSALTLVAEFFILSGISKAGAGRAASVEILYPIFTIALTAIILSTKFTLVEILGSVLAVSGVALILWSNL